MFVIVAIPSLDCFFSFSWRYIIMCMGQKHTFLYWSLYVIRVCICLYWLFFFCLVLVRYRGWCPCHYAQKNEKNTRERARERQRKIKGKSWRQWHRKFHVKFNWIIFCYSFNRIFVFVLKFAIFLFLLFIFFLFVRLCEPSFSAFICLCHLSVLVRSCASYSCSYSINVRNENTERCRVGVDAGKYKVYERRKKKKKNSIWKINPSFRFGENWIFFSSFSHLV